MYLSCRKDKSVYLMKKSNSVKTLIKKCASIFCHFLVYAGLLQEYHNV